MKKKTCIECGLKADTLAFVRMGDGRGDLDAVDVCTKCLIENNMEEVTENQQHNQYFRGTDSPANRPAGQTGGDR